MIECKKFENDTFEWREINWKYLLYVNIRPKNASEAGEGCAFQLFKNKNSKPSCLKARLISKEDFIKFSQEFKSSIIDHLIINLDDGIDATYDLNKKQANMVLEELIKFN